jgi:aminoglycoside/choline kinase family phosphotransferase
VSQNGEKKNMEAELQSFVQREERVVRSIEKLPGDASTRSYYRVSTDRQEMVAMSMEPFEAQGGKIPFLAVQRHLSRCGVDVPNVIDYDPAKGLILLEDLGDITLLRRLHEVESEAEERKYFEKAIDALVKMHVRSGPAHALNDEERSAVEGFRLKFDVEKLMWEVNFTMEHFFFKFLQRKISDADLAVIQDGFTKICSELDAIPTVFTHRDYHSRNLMITGDAKDERFVLIDFQDARMGPPQYDLASLLRDSYYQLEEKQIDDLVDYYLMRMKEEGAEIKDKSQFLRHFDLMSVQRNFKAIGSFASFMNRRGNPAYLKFIGNTFENIRRNLKKYPEFKKLREVLYYHYYF